jgi:ABC-2 type transport system permease protein
MFWIIGWLKNLVDPGMARFVDYISITRHFESFTKGVLDTRDLIYYLLFIVLFLFFTLRQMESYRWRG